ncbi:hypothetical protein A2767_00465 [Candidatus Roizmanbacteria bacterium RIFCSPHIGHO2_01_FULL_35_10]|uniref:Uncharacterized protein n=1 Tax=Candidatus Roizmanbacteria bacterium RIFCSPLOWO2_01_FULL_35_13 TaxID=1802055 RepID=A0A1F7IHK1_9BACT|nr:MAG: hypothetical protein A2767_00465 [Candidatus Roizmanbacteria bacterium RIFCSPHIGHO2_01_FULL_35_10]OGK42813.1 MAG: hypothetical protein A3A74_01230 [Candidatus Roizmanbacteria bacterium RIFCSPLOWO2_01_FULL_35_13]
MKGESVLVPYGQVRTINRKDTIEFVGLYVCLAVALMNEARSTGAHVPIIDSFCIFDDYGNITKTSNFDELMSNLFLEFGTISDYDQAIIAGGVKGISSDKIIMIKNKLKDKGITKITTKGPHNKNVEWNVEVKAGRFNYNSRLYRPLNSRGEYSS